MCPRPAAAADMKTNTHAHTLRDLNRTQRASAVSAVRWAELKVHIFRGYGQV